MIYCQNSQAQASAGLTDATCSPIGRVKWQAANLQPCDCSEATVRAWQLRVNGRVILNAVALTDIHEAVSADDRKLIGQALAEYLANASLSHGDGGATPLHEKS